MKQYIPVFYKTVPVFYRTVGFDGLSRITAICSGMIVCWWLLTTQQKLTSHEEEIEIGVVHVLRLGTSTSTSTKYTSTY
jgi:hypothetical protein